MEPSRMENHTLPDDVVNSIIKYMSDSAKHIGFVSLTCKHWVKRAYQALDFIQISRDDIPLSILEAAEASPAHVEILSDEAPSWSPQEKVIVAKLLSTATNVVWFDGRVPCRPQLFAGCLKNVQVLAVGCKHKFGKTEPLSLDALLLGLPPQRSSARDDAPHPLRELHFYKYEALGTKDFYILAKEFPKLEKLSFDFVGGLPIIINLSRMRSLKMLQFCCSFTSEIEKLCRKGAFTAVQKDMSAFKRSLPEQLTLSSVFLKNKHCVTFPLDSLLFLAATSQAEMETALKDSPLSDPHATLMALCCLKPKSKAVRHREMELMPQKINILASLGADPLRSAPVSYAYPIMSWGSPLHISVAFGSNSAMQAILKYVESSPLMDGIVDRVRDPRGFTPLHLMPKSFEQWMECYMWFIGKVKGWKFIDRSNLYNASPLLTIMMFSESTKVLEFLKLVRFIVETHAKALQSDERPLLVGTFLHSVADIWTACRANSESRILIHSIMAPLVQHLLELKLGDFDHPKLVATLSPLRSAFMDTFDPEDVQRTASIMAFLLEFGSNVFKVYAPECSAQQLVDCLSLALNPQHEAFKASTHALPLINLFCDTWKSLGNNLPPLAGLGTDILPTDGRPVLYTCLKHHMTDCFFGLVLHGVIPITPTKEQNSKLLRKLFETLDSGKISNASALHGLSELVRQYLEADRFDLALLVVEGAALLAYDIARIAHGNNNNSIADLPMAQLLIRSAQVLFANPFAVSNIESNNELLGPLLFIVMGPYDLLPFSTDQRCALVRRVVDKLTSTPDVHISMKSSLRCWRYYSSIFHPASLSFLLLSDDNEMRKTLVNVLPGLLERFEDASCDKVIPKIDFDDMKYVEKALKQDPGRAQEYGLISRVSTRAKQCKETGAPPSDSESSKSDEFYDDEDNDENENDDDE